MNENEKRKFKREYDRAWYAKNRFRILAREAKKRWQRKHSPLPKKLGLPDDIVQQMLTNHEFTTNEASNNNSNDVRSIDSPNGVR